MKQTKKIVSMICYSFFLAVGICLCFIGFQSVHISLHRSGDGVVNGTVSNTYVGFYKIDHNYANILKTEIYSTRRTSNLKIITANENDRIFFGDNQKWNEIKTLESKLGAFLLNQNEFSFEETVKANSSIAGIVGIMFTVVSLLYISGLLGLNEIKIGKFSITSPGEH